MEVAQLGVILLIICNFTAELPFWPCDCSRERKRSFRFELCGYVWVCEATHKWRRFALASLLGERIEQRKWSFLKRGEAEFQWDNGLAFCWHKSILWTWPLAWPEKTHLGRKYADSSPVSGFEPRYPGCLLHCLATWAAEIIGVSSSVLKSKSRRWDTS